MKRLSPELPLLRHLNQFIKASVSGRRRTSSGKKITAGTIVNYKYAYKLLEEFEQKHGIHLRIQLTHKASLQTIKREKSYWDRFFLNFSEFLYKDKKYFDNYVANIFKIIRTFFNYLEKEKGFIVGKYHRAFRIPLQQLTPVVLTPQQLNFLITNKEFEQSLSPSLKTVKDIFVFGCTVALRYSDLMRLKKSNLVNRDGKIYLELHTQKTSTAIRIQLPKYAIEIANKYGRKTNARLLPRLSSTNVNLQVKKLVRAAGWQDELIKSRSREGKIVELKTEAGKTWQFCEHITAHTMRRTAITTLLILGVPENVVRKLSGHAPGSNEFYKYVSLAQDYINQELQRAYVKLTDQHLTKSLQKAG